MTDKKKLTATKSQEDDKTSKKVKGGSGSKSGSGGGDGSGNSGGGKKYRLVKKGEYDKLKRRALKFEKDNNGYVLVIPCDGNEGWYEMGDKSALFYAYEVCDKIGADVSIKDDYDRFYDQFKVGRVRVKGVDAVRDRLKRAEMYKGETEKDGCTIFELKKKYTEDETEALLMEEMRRQQELNEIVKVKLADPVLLTKMLEVSGRLHAVCQHKMEAIARETNGVRIVGLCDNMMIQYYEMSETEDMSPEHVYEMWKTLRGYIHRLLIEMQIIIGLKIWKRKQCVGIGEMIRDMEMRVETHMRKIKAKGQPITRTKA